MSKNKIYNNFYLVKTGYGYFQIIFIKQMKMLFSKKSSNQRNRIFLKRPCVFLEHDTLDHKLHKGNGLSPPLLRRNTLTLERPCIQRQINRYYRKKTP